MEYHYIDYHYMDYHYMDCHYMDYHYMDYHYMDYHYMDCHYIDYHYIDYHCIDYYYVSPKSFAMIFDKSKYCWVPEWFVPDHLLHGQRALPLCWFEGGASQLRAAIQTAACNGTASSFSSAAEESLARFPV